MIPSAYETYRRTLTSMDEEESAWWYLGTTTLQVEGHPEIVVNHVETVMIYGSQSLGQHAYRVPWWEIGLFRDALTGELADQWFNPLTGGQTQGPRTFEEGPSGYSIRAAQVGVEMFDAVQAFARLDCSAITVRELGGRAVITQDERKVRSFPGADGIPDLDAGEGTRSHTVLQWIADAADLAGDAPSVPATGFYSFEIGPPPWIGLEGRPSKFMVKGLMQKANLDPPLNRRGWEDLQRLFPHYFKDGRIQPRWQ
jgi:hypothetical protein